MALLPPPPNQKGSEQLKQTVLVTLVVALICLGTVAVHKTRENLANAGVQYDADGHPTSWPCANDARRLCPDVPAGKGQVNGCLRAHDSDISKACLDYMEEVDPSNDWLNVCHEELQTVCAGRRYTVPCLKENAARLSPRCGALVNNYEAITRWRNACASDAERLCPDVPPDQIAAGSCLQAKLNNLTVSCRVYYQAQAQP